MNKKKILINLKMVSVFAIILLLLGSGTLPTSVTVISADNTNGNNELNEKYRIYLNSRNFIPNETDIDSFQSLAQRKVDEKDEYLLIQFYSIPSIKERETLNDYGVKLFDYFHHNTYSAFIPVENQDEVLSLNYVRWIGEFLPEDKLQSKILNDDLGSWTIDKNNLIKLNVQFYDSVPLKDIQQLLKYYTTSYVGPGMLNDWTIKIDEKNIVNFANENYVRFISEISPPEILFNDGCRDLVKANVVQSNVYNLNGTGIQIGIWDGGEVDSNHADLSGRVTVVEPTNVGDHATHVAGTMISNGANSNGLYRGMATNATLFSYTFTGNDFEPEEHEDAIHQHAIDLSQNSWGLDQNFGEYSVRSSKYDNIIYGIYDKAIPIVFAAGNEQDETVSGYNTTAGPGGTSKNIITVGAVNSNDKSMTDFSSWGPLKDGRLKPDIVAPGSENNGPNACIDLYTDMNSGVWSTVPDNHFTDCVGSPCQCVDQIDDYQFPYSCMVGTSMAAPVVSGCISLIIQDFKNYNHKDPLPSTIKSLLIQTAEDLNDSTQHYNPGPDYASGYGLINIQDAIDVLRDDGQNNERIIEGHLVDNEDVDKYKINVPVGTTNLKFTISWADMPGNTADSDSLPELMNDLNLILTDPNGLIYYPWTLDSDNPSHDAAQDKLDHLNPVEQVAVSGSNIPEGTWTITMNSSKLPGFSQSYSLIGSMPMEYDHEVQSYFGDEWDEDADGVNHPPTGSYNNYGPHSLEISPSIFDGGESSYLFDFDTDFRFGDLYIGCFFKEISWLGNGPDLCLYNWDNDEWKTWTGIGTQDSLKWIWKTVDLSSRYISDDGKILVKIIADANDDTIIDTVKVKFNPINHPIYRGLEFLSDAQQGDPNPDNGDGSWLSNVGITALCTLSFLNYGFNESDNVVADAINYLLSPDNMHWHQASLLGIYNPGSINRATYMTSLSLLALKATNNPDYDDEIQAMKDFLVELQWDDSSFYGSVSPSSWYWGGFGYGSHSRPDLSNTQFALMALSAAGATNADDNCWDDALVFLDRVKKSSGAYTYTPGGGEWGSMTAAGLWSLRLAGVDMTDARITNSQSPFGALDWIKNHYTWSYNPGEGQSAFYYYCMALSKALVMCHKDNLVINGVTNDWAADMFSELEGRQKTDGSWVGTPPRMENVPELATAYALLALETRSLSPGADLWTSIILASHADLHLYDNQGKHTGKIYDENGDWTGDIEVEIPGSSYELVNGKQIINLSELDPASYRIELVGTSTGDYNLSILGGQDQLETYNETWPGNITADEVHSSTMTITAMMGSLTIITSEPELSPVITTIPEELVLYSCYGGQINDSFEISSSFANASGVSIYATDMIDSQGNIIDGDTFTFNPNDFEITKNTSVEVEISGTMPIIDGDWVYNGEFIIESSNAGAKSIDVTIIMDHTPPVTTKNIAQPTYGADDYYVTPHSEFTLLSSDDYSQVSSTYYRIWNNGVWNPLPGTGGGQNNDFMVYTDDFTLSDEGKTFVEFYSVDNAGNVENVTNQTHVVYDWWSMYQHDAKHSGDSMSGIPDSSDVVWIQDLHAPVYSSPSVVYDGRLYVGSFDRNVYCLNASTGDVIWTFDTGSLVESSPAVSDGLVFVGSNTGDLNCLDYLTGELVWSYHTILPVQSGPVVYDDYVFFGSYELYCVNKTTGELLWKEFLGSPLRSSPAVFDDKVVAASMSGDIMCYSCSDGSVMWSFDTYAPIQSSPCVVNDLVVVGCDNGGVYCLHKESGELQWMKSMYGSVLSSPVIVDDSVVVASRDNHLYRLDLEDGSVIWSKFIAPFSFSSPAVSGNRLVIGSTNGRMYCVNTTDGSVLWDFKTAAAISSSPAVFNGCVFVGSMDGNLYCFGESTTDLFFDPIAYVSGPYFGNVNEDICFNGSASYEADENGESIDRYDWKFYAGDTWHNDLGANPSFTYEYEGSYQVSLRVIDDENEMDVDTTEVTITDPETPMIVEMSDVSIDISQDSMGVGLIHTTATDDSVGSCEMTVSFDPSVVQVGDVFGSDFDVISESIDNTLGTVSLLASNSEEGLTGSFVIAELLFEAVTDDDSGCTLSVTGSELLSDDASPITIDHTCDDGWLEIFSDDQTGDMNGDGKVNSGDVRYLGMFLAGDPAYSPLYADGDVNGDGNVNSGDVRYLGMFLAGDPDYHPLYP